MKKYDTYSFAEYPPIEILGTDIYLKSIKRLSFQYRTKEGDILVAYVALSKENIPLNIPNIGEHMKGCRILSIYVGAEIINGYEVDNVALRMTLLDEAEYYINGWVNSENNANFIFDYFWFYNEDIKKGEIIDEIGYMTTVNDISFKLINRHNAN